MLICGECYNREIVAHIEARQRREEALTAEEIKRPEDYFVSSIPSIKEIFDSVSSDDSITHKNERIAVLVKQRIEHLQNTILEKNQKLRDLSNEKRQVEDEKKATEKLREESVVYLNNKVRELTVEARKRLGLTIYEQPEGKIKTPSKAPSVGHTGSSRISSAALAELDKYSKMYNIPLEFLQLTMKMRKVGVEEAVKIYMALNNDTTDPVQS